MDKKLAGLLGAVAGLATMGSAGAAVQDRPASALPAATSYAELLGPVDNATALLVADDDARVQQSDVRVRLAQYHDHHHHHHHTRIIIRRHHHHHHPRIIIRRRHHHHHHHHHSMYMQGAPKKA